MGIKVVEDGNKRSRRWDWDGKMGLKEVGDGDKLVR